MIFHSGRYNKYALYCAAFCLAVFVFLGADNFASSALCALLLFLFVPVLLFIRGDYKYYCRIAVKAIIFALAGILVAVFARAVYFLPAQDFLNEYSGTSCDMLVEIKSVVSAGDEYANYDAVILCADGKSVRSNLGVYPGVRITDFTGDRLEIGEVVRFTATAKSPDRTTDTGFREKKHLESRSIFISCTVESPLELVSKRQPDFIQRTREKMSSGISEYIGKHYNGYEAAFSKCMLLGDKSGVEGQLKDIFRVSGISHILSVSGLHLSILLYTVSYILGIGRNRKRRRFPSAEVISCIVALAYMAVANFTPSIMRAGFMMIITNLFGIYRYYCLKFAKPGINIGEKFESFGSLSSLFIAAAVICVVSPYSLYDIGMQLSFLSTLGIILVMPVYQKYRRRYIPFFLEPFAASLVITLSALSFTFPVCVYNFGTLSSVSAISNLLVTPVIIPLLAMLLFLALLSLLPSGFIVVFICSLLGKICGFLSSLCIKVAKVNSSFLFSSLNAEDNFIVNMIFSALVISAVVFAIYRYEKVSLMMCAFTVGLFLICFSAYFGETLLHHSKPVLSITTDSQTQYACAQAWDNRVYLDNATSLTERHLLKDVMCPDTYDTHNVYCAVISKDSDFETLYYNIRLFDEVCGVDVLILPAAENAQDIGNYADFITLLSQCGYEIEFYENKFSVGKIEFALETAQDYSSVGFSDYSVVFSESYNEELAQSIAGNKEYCVYFCKKAGVTDNTAYTSRAKLFVTSPYHKDINGAERIIPNKITVLE